MRRLGSKRRRSEVKAKEHREWKERREREGGRWGVSRVDGEGDRDRGGVVGQAGIGRDGGEWCAEPRGGIILFFALLYKSGVLILTF